LSVSTALASTKTAATLIDDITASLPQAYTADVVSVQITKVARVDVPTPAGVSLGAMVAALEAQLCADDPSCSVATATSRLRRARSLQSSDAYLVTRSLDASSDASLAPPTVDATALAAELNSKTNAAVTASELPVATSVVSVEASVTVQGAGSASSDAAASAVAALHEMPTQLEVEHGADSFALTSVNTIAPPSPPPVDAGGDDGGTGAHGAPSRTRWLVAIGAPIAGVVAVLVAVYCVLKRRKKSTTNGEDAQVQVQVQVELSRPHICSTSNKDQKNGFI